MTDTSAQQSVQLLKTGQLPNLSEQGTVLAFDFGQKRIGVAIGDTALGLAHPLTTINSEKNEQRFSLISTLIENWQPVFLVVGLPCHMDGSAHEMTRLSQRFAQRLSGRFSMRVLLVDERYTSKTACAALHQAGISAKKQKQYLDQVAAQHILQSFFDEYYAQHFIA
ncbi:Holliday junction resolvase RuvX [Nitrosomonas sp.]|uniref:Holliday junction resolvase RuvX n=1 Tax=Nitrosomonas sp. TaxID=42353 RepID=UPI001DAD48E3|nr:Holliday junction resolvase RuvX [Nitrosomonas sp.]MCB1948262.1 Holliday junction resolvase RuvX [Nitrosomonas sp.]MCP5243396.1 Holliday junction resolvase RuvX [Burkholderiales bacterium]MDR4514838.1 Holliday junction resolvase RuvX [Nitrosomonas sp.]